MDPQPVSAPTTASSAALLAALEERSRARPDRVVRLIGRLPAAAGDPPPAADCAGADEPFELLIFRGFSSLTTHPTAFDPDQPALPEGSHIASAELLQAPLIPDAELSVAGPGPVQALLGGDPWP